VSYTVEVVAGAPPRSYEGALAARDEAVAAHDEAVEASGEPFVPPSPRMRELHQRLTARYPCITVDDGGPWSDGPLINNFGRDIATLGISYSRVEEVLPFLVRAANEMGLWVLDCQDEVLHLPDGTRRPSLASLGIDISPRPESRWWQFWK
jgi:hypothetical protein